MNLKVIITMCAVIVALTSVAGLMTIVESGYQPDVDTDRRIHGGWEGGGSHPDVVGDDRKYGELYSATRYFTSYDGMGRSELIVVSGKLVSTPDWLKCGVTKVVYEFYIYDGTDEDGNDLGPTVKFRKLKTEGIEDGTWTEKAPIVMGSVWDVPPAIFRLDGYWPDGAIIHVEMVAHCLTGGPPLGLGAIEYVMAEDQARLIQGDGKLTWGRDRYEVGVDKNAVLNWFVPAVDSEVEDRRAYKIFVTKFSTGELLVDGHVVEGKSGTIKIPLTEDLVEGGGEDVLIARLWNDIFQKDVTAVPVTIIGGFYAPGDPPMTEEDYPQMHSVTTDKGEYWEGELATITIDATAGRYPISHYFLLCEIEGTEVVSPKSISTATYSFQVSVAGVLECEAIAFDIYGNPSEKREVSATVENQMLGDYCDRYPDDPICTGEDTKPGLNWIEILIIVLLVIALFALVVFAVWIMIQIGAPWWLLLTVVGVMLLVGLIAIGMMAVDYGKT